MEVHNTSTEIITKMTDNRYDFYGIFQLNALLKSFRELPPRIIKNYYSIIFLRCCSPHFCMDVNTSESVSLYEVSAYSTVMGFVSHTVRLISPFISSSCSSFDNILGEISTSLDISLNLRLPPLSMASNISFHFPPTTSSVSCIANLFFAHFKGSSAQEYFKSIIRNFTPVTICNSNKFTPVLII